MAITLYEVALEYANVEVREEDTHKTLPTPDRQTLKVNSRGPAGWDAAVDATHDGDRLLQVTRWARDLSPDDHGPESDEVRRRQEKPHDNCGP